MMTSVAATSGNKQSAQTTVQFFKTTFEQLSLQKKTFDFLLGAFGQLFEKLRDFFGEISSNMWKAHKTPRHWHLTEERRDGGEVKITPI